MVGTYLCNTIYNFSAISDVIYFTILKFSGSDSELPDVTSGSKDEPLFPSNVQCYWRMPSLTVLIFDVCIFITLGLAGGWVPGSCICMYMYIRVSSAN